MIIIGACIVGILLSISLILYEIAESLKELIRRQSNG